MTNPLKILRDGRQLLDPVLEKHGFEWAPGESGTSSGGDFACGEYVRGDRRLEIHFRHSLGLVTYHVGRDSFEHPAYMRVLLGPNGGNKYPGFSGEPLDAFRDLAHDLNTFCGAFLSGSDEEFRELAERVVADSKITGIKRLP
jgi:hypothetical protein